MQFTSSDLVNTPSTANEFLFGYSNISLSVNREYDKELKGQNMKSLRIKLKEDIFSGRVMSWNAFENY
jgi:hypothetical protein